MRLTVWLFGAEVVAVDIGAGDHDRDHDRDDSPGDCTTTPVGFTPGSGDQRWQPGTDYQ